jgi:hypothetical protein
MRVPATPPSVSAAQRSNPREVQPDKPSSGRRRRVRVDTAEISKEGHAAAAADLAERGAGASGRQLHTRRGDADRDGRVTLKESKKLEPS